MGRKEISLEDKKRILRDFGVRFPDEATNEMVHIMHSDLMAEYIKIINSYYER